ncbi:MAG TPA: NAD(P)-dependent oxidoreductase [Immundisolibacter sp.]
MQRGFVGVGTMGAPIVGHLVAAGHTVRAFDLSADALAKAQAAGAQAADSVGEAAAGAQAVFVAVSNQDVLGEVLRQPGGIFECAAPGAIVVDLGTTAPPRCRAFAAEARAVGMDYVDAPLSGSTPWAQAGTLAVMVGAEQAAWDTVLPLLQTFGGSIFHLGPVGSGQTAKLCQNLILVSTLSGVMESVARGRAVGIEPRRLLEVMDTCLAPTRVMDVLVKPKFDGRVPFDHSTEGLTMICKDITLVRDLAQRVGVHLPVGSRIQSLYQQAVEKGHGRHDLLAWYELIEQGVFEAG